MKIDAHELVCLASIMKSAIAAESDKEEDKEKAKPKPKRKRKKPNYSAAYPHYRRSLVNQYSESPGRAGARRGVGSGALGAILGALIGRLTGGTGATTLAGAAGGGLLGGAAGYHSGAREAESEHSRLLSLRRAGVETPGELEILTRHPELLQSKGLTAPGVRL